MAVLDPREHSIQRPAAARSAAAVPALVVGGSWFALLAALGVPLGLSFAVAVAALVTAALTLAVTRGGSLSPGSPAAPDARSERPPGRTS